MAGIDGLRNKIEPPEPIDKDLYELPPEEHASVEQVPGSLPEVLNRHLNSQHQTPELPAASLFKVSGAVGDVSALIASAIRSSHPRSIP